MNKEKSKEIIEMLKGIIENPRCELNYSNNFELIIAVSLSAQTTDKRVNEVTPALFSKYPDPETLMNAEYTDVLSMIKVLGLAKTKAANIIHMAEVLHNEFHDEVPSDMENLMKLPGVGRKTASVILAEGFHIPALPVDTHLVRMARRLGYSKSEDPFKVETDYKRYIPKEDWILSHHLLLLFGRYHCKAVNPECSSCKLKEYCKEKQKTQ